MKANAVILILLLGLVGFIGAGALVLRDHRESQELPVFAEATQFAFTDQNGAPFSSERMQGKLWVANFFFTSCEGICPTINGAVARFAEKIRGQSPVEFVSMSVDPKNDTPAVLKEYAAKFKADPSRWHFLTGAEGEVEKVMASFKLGSFDDPINHTSRLVLVDEKGRVRGYYQGTDENAVEFLTRDVQSLTRILKALP
jgi:protein SCO1/2